MEWKELSALLVKTKTLLGSNDAVKDCVVQVLADTLKVVISKESISVKNGIVFLSVHPAIKNDLLIRKKEIIEKIQTSGFKNQIIDIR